MLGLVGAKIALDGGVHLLFGKSADAVVNVVFRGQLTSFGHYVDNNAAKSGSLGG